MNEPLIQALDVSKTYDGSNHVEVLSHLDAVIGRGEVVAVVGQSGVGKSTLLHILGTLDRPTEGTVLFGGTDIFALSEREQAAFRNREIGFIFQFHHLLPDFNALENVMMPALIQGQGHAQAQEAAEKLLERVGLRNRLDHRPGQLSGGEQQRVAIARAIVLSPRVVLADEPTGNLDPDTAGGVHRLLMELNRENGMTMVLVTHNEDLSRLAHRTLRLQHGRLVETAG